MYNISILNVCCLGFFIFSPVHCCPVHFDSRKAHLCFSFRVNSFRGIFYLNFFFEFLDDACKLRNQ